MTIKSLYISDLDGTLLNSHKEISENTKKTLNTLVASGGYFSVATARTAVSSQKILSGVQVNTPVVLMNGAVIYDILDGKYIKTETIPAAAAYTIVEVIKKHKITGFMYSVFDNRLQVYYESLNTTVLKAYHNERVTKYAKSFEQIASFSDKIKDNKVIYFVFMGKKERLSELLPDLKKLQGIDMVLSNDVYTENLWYLEVYSTNASKYNAVNYIRNYCSFDRIIGFGDNFNDIPLLKACDEFYAVSNAVYELKEKSTGIIANNNSDGVARFIVARREF
ncbi:HAD family hydrolase [Sporomusa sp.]|uniref:HAD family hydrolase n=1 Tax=Sporomusa sp. TaxID=2078658 RepID=UPI002CF39714|nr:HAD family hydrolase [Sporomusa sp.]HWR43906.1 HAD family hydrolase [Sporomusa sp.]